MKSRFFSIRSRWKKIGKCLHLVAMERKFPHISDFSLLCWFFVHRATWNSQPAIYLSSLNWLLLREENQGKVGAFSSSENVNNRKSFSVVQVSWEKVWKLFVNRERILKLRKSPNQLVIRNHVQSTGFLPNIRNFWNFQRIFEVVENSKFGKVNFFALAMFSGKSEESLKNFIRISCQWSFIINFFLYLFSF